MDLSTMNQLYKTEEKVSHLASKEVNWIDILFYGRRDFEALSKMRISYRWLFRGIITTDR